MQPLKALVIFDVEKHVYIFVCGILLCFAALLTGCERKEPFAEVKRDKLTVQIRKLAGDPEGGSGVSYAARIIPERALAGANELTLKTKMEYHADSTFISTWENKRFMRI